MCVLSIKVPIRKKSGNLFNEPCTTCILDINLPVMQHVFWSSICLLWNMYFGHKFACYATRTLDINLSVMQHVFWSSICLCQTRININILDLRSQNKAMMAGLVHTAKTTKICLSNHLWVWFFFLVGQMILTL